MMPFCTESGGYSLVSGLPRAGIAAVKLFTHHPRKFKVDDPKLVINPTQGDFWKNYPAYRQALPKLQEIVGTTQFLWCEIVRSFVRVSEAHDIVRWEIEIPFNDVLAFIDDACGWKSLFTDTPGVDWSRVIASPTEQEVTLTENQRQQLARTGHPLSCLVRVPVTNATVHEMTPIHGARKLKR
jgi:hypothetical protein